MLQALGVALRLGEREEVTVEDVLSKGVALPVAQAESVRCKEAEALLESVRSGVADAVAKLHEVGVGLPVRERAAVPLVLPLPDAHTEADAMPETEGHALDEALVVPPPLAEGDSVALLQREGDWLVVCVVETEAQVDQLCTPVMLTLLQAETLCCMEAEVLTEAEPRGVGETLGEAEAEPATLALPQWVPEAHAVALDTTVALLLLRSEAVGGTEAEVLIEEAKEGEAE